ncbi:TetR/AcrR family transcriptional regulator [Aurantiacibacter xanthus]|uniref:TetR/AcrR family transcriptional regulator n=1 Tax=Aurantiacibacter xanthus TaxID=1784712 RepID=UPI001C723DA6|nr:TetR/AcrR family transcriptional regulator [Aurantiacibacter xanthus]
MSSKRLKGPDAEPQPATRERLILEAERLFGERGIDGVTMRMICEAAGQKFAGSVQYHFGDLEGLLYAVFEYREERLQPQRRAILDEARTHGLTGDLRQLLRAVFEPNYRMFADEGNISYMRCHAAYLTTHRPRGVEHPVDRASPTTVALREAMDLLDRRLAVLGPSLPTRRLECVGTMFLLGMVEYAADPSRYAMSVERWYEELLDMMVQAISVLPRVTGDAQA